MNDFCETLSAPSRTRIKFCGFTRAEDIDRATALGVDAIGLVCVPASGRAVSVEDAAALRAAVPAFVSCVVLLLDPQRAEVEAVVERVRPDLLQFHGQEPADFCNSFGLPYLKAIGMAGDKNARIAAGRYPDAAALMLDGHAPGKLGGTGMAFDWRRADAFATRRLVLAGGLDSSNVAQAITVVHPYAVDVSSGIERSPGVKDSGKMIAFVDAVRRVDARAATDAQLS